MAGLTPAKRLQLSHREDKRRGLTADQISQIKIYTFRCMAFVLADACRRTQTVITDLNLSSPAWAQICKIWLYTREELFDRGLLQDPAVLLNAQTSANSDLLLCAEWLPLLAPSCGNSTFTKISAIMILVYLAQHACTWLQRLRNLSFRPRSLSTSCRISVVRPLTFATCLQICCLELEMLNSTAACVDGSLLYI